MRLFFSLDLPPDLRSKAWSRSLEIQQDCRSLNAKWVQEENLHFTLIFLGETPPDRLELVKHAARRAAQQARPFEASLAGLGVFPSTRQAKVLWLAIDKGQDQFKGLAQQLSAFLTETQVPFDLKEPKAHLTLARFRVPAILEGRPAGHLQRPDPALGSWTVTEFILYESHLSPHGPTYQSLEKFKLLRLA